YTNINQIKILYKFFNENNILDLLLTKIDFPEFEKQEQVDKDYTKIKDYVVRFVVGSDYPNEMWKNKQLYDEWSNNYCEILNEANQIKDISYLNGEIEMLKTFFPQKIRHQGDGAKLLSANDETIFTFGGRFNPKFDNQAVTLGQSSMQKALYALRWLIHKQAYEYHTLNILTWSVGKIDALNAFTLDNLKDDDDDFLVNKDSGQGDEFNSLSNNVVSAIAHYGQYSKNLEKLSNDDMVNVVVLDGDVKGRISICYYNEFESSQYYSNLKHWFEKTQWIYKKDGKRMLKTPTFYDIYKICYWQSLKDKKIYGQFLKQILPCVIENKKLTQVLVKLAFNNIKQRSAFSDGEWYWCLCTTCALLNNYMDLGGKYMELDKENANRSYLFGRLIAVAEDVERAALKFSGEDNGSSTNAERLFTQFTVRPSKTWFTLEKQLQPYYEKLHKCGKSGLVHYFKNMIQEILSNMNEEDFMSNKSVDEMFILGYYGQRNSYKSSKENDEEDGE
ncbi:MAG: type I-C CRISPR-associated protein Cas8c/Csd1, partial [Christensenellales bacterium]